MHTMVLAEVYIYMYIHTSKPNSAKHVFNRCSRAGNHDWVPRFPWALAMILLAFLRSNSP